MGAFRTLCIVITSRNRNTICLVFGISLCICFTGQYDQLLCAWLYLLFSINLILHIYYFIFLLKFRILEILRDEIRNCIANNTMGKVIVNHSGRVTGTQGDVSSSVMTLNKAECFKMVTRACSEYLTNPTISTIQRACLLDRAILVSFYKYLITISDSSLKFLTGYDLYIRLADLLKQIQLKQATSHANQHIAGTSTNGGSLQSYGIHLLFPPWNIFKLAIQRLLTQGLVSIHMIDGSHFHHSNHRMIGYSESMQHPLDMLQSLVLSVVIDTNDIKTALRTSEFAPFL